MTALSRHLQSGRKTVFPSRRQEEFSYLPHPNLRSPMAERNRAQLTSGSMEPIRGYLEGIASVVM